MKPGMCKFTLRSGKKSGVTCITNKRKSREERSTDRSDRNRTWDSPHVSTPLDVGEKKFVVQCQGISFRKVEKEKNTQKKEFSFHSVWSCVVEFLNGRSKLSWCDLKSHCGFLWLRYMVVLCPNSTRPAWKAWCGTPRVKTCYRLGSGRGPSVWTSRSEGHVKQLTVHSFLVA
jgi:hypothetical protein